MNGNWNVNYTFEKRYEQTGIVDLILDYAKQHLKQKLVVVDVGCSFGKAMKYAQNYLEKKGIESYTIGIDGSKKVSADAKKNLDDFIGCDVTDVVTLTEDSRKNLADFIGCDVSDVATLKENANIVICSKMAIWVAHDVQYRIIEKCAEFLKNDGKLITDVGCFKSSKLHEGIKFKRSSLRRPDAWIVRVKAMDKNNVKNFVRNIQSVKDDMTCIEKVRFEFMKLITYAPSWISSKLKNYFV